MYYLLLPEIYQIFHLNSLPLRRDVAQLEEHFVGMNETLGFVLSTAQHLVWWLFLCSSSHEVEAGGSKVLRLSLVMISLDYRLSLVT